MRGNKKLIQRISKAGATGILACAVSFSLPQIMQTEDTLQIKGYGISGRMFELGEDDLFHEVLSRAMAFGRNDMITVEAAARDNKNLYLSENIVKTQGSGSDSLIDDADEKEDTLKTAVDNEENTDDDVKAKADNIKENAKTSSKTAAASGEDTQETSDTEKSKNKSAKAETDVKAKKESTASKKETTESKKKAATKSSAKEKTVSAEKAATKAKSKTAKQTSEAKKWNNRLMADVDDRLNIRKSSSEDSEIVGRLRKGDAAKVLKKGKEWTKIKSGSVTGYVKNEYCVYGAKAYKMAKKVCATYASVQTDGLRIRQKPSEKATILDAAYKGDKLKVNTKEKEKDGWVVVEMDGLNGYVSEEYVNVALGTGRALSIEEELAQIAAEKAQEEAAARAAAKSAAASTVSASSNRTVASNASPVQAASSDLTLLSAIIYCEAGGESYAGQVAVGAVVMNRVNSGSFPNSISGVVYQSGQFSPVANGALSRALSNGSYQNCVSAAREALAGSDNTGGAKFFHRVNGDAGLVIGNHVFY